MSPNNLVAFDEFVANDFASMDAKLMARCMKLHGRRLYLSGATGFFGKNLLSLLAHLERQGAVFSVTALSRSPDRFLAEQPWCRRLQWLEWRTGDVSAPWPGTGTYDCLIHAATDTAASAHLDKMTLFDEIIAGARNAMEFAALRGIRRLLLTGSGAQYGAIPERYSSGVPEASQLACDTAKTTSAYGEGKRASEILAALYSQKHGIDVINTRCFAFVGPGLPLDGHFAIGNFIRNALDGQPIRLATDGEAVRSYLYGADLAVWLMLLLLEADNGTVVNVGSDSAISVLDLATRVRDVVNPTVAVRAGMSASGGERNYYVPSIARARALGLDAWTNLDRAIARTALWHRIGTDQRPMASGLHVSPITPEDSPK